MDPVAIDNSYLANQSKIKAITFLFLFFNSLKYEKKIEKLIEY